MSGPLRLTAALPLYLFAIIGAITALGIEINSVRDFIRITHHSVANAIVYGAFTTILAFIVLIVSIGAWTLANAIRGANHPRLIKETTR